MNIKETFLKATKYLVPFKMENLLEPFLPKNIQKDSIGNYFIKIGESKSMFTCHLDSYTKKLIEVNQILYDNDTKVKTDGKSPLGGDDKTGMCVMLNMIEHNVPGTYFFFIGEEPTLSGGVYGSKLALSKNPEFFKQFDRVIAFDRKAYGSIISKQNGNVCCSKEFVLALSKEFDKQGMKYENDPTGYYTDSAVFMWDVPEITNLSCGGFNEHKNTEWVDLVYLEKLANVAIKIDWESLPASRDPLKYKPRDKKKVPNRLNNYGINIFKFNNFTKKSGYDLYKIIEDYMKFYEVEPLPNQKFAENKNIIFVDSDNSENIDKIRTRIKIKIKGSQIWVNDNKIGSLDNFERSYEIGFYCKFFNSSEKFLNDLKEYCKKYNTNQVPFHDVQIILKKYGSFTLNEFLFNYDSENALFDDDDFIIDDVNNCLEL